MPYLVIVMREHGRSVGIFPSIVEAFKAAEENTPSTKWGYFVYDLESVSP